MPTIKEMKEKVDTVGVDEQFQRLSAACTLSGALIGNKALQEVTWVATVDVPLRDEVRTGLKLKVARPGEILAIATPLPLCGRSVDSIPSWGQQTIGTAAHTPAVTLIRGAVEIAPGCEE